MAYAEELNLAIACYRAGQFDKGYELLKGVYASMYQGALEELLAPHLAPPLKAAVFGGNAARFYRIPR